MPQMPPTTPKNRAAGIPTRREITAAVLYATKIEAGDSMARNTIADPYAALQKSDPIATVPSNGATSTYLPE